MSIRHRLPLENRRRLVHWLAAASLCLSDVCNADSPPVEVPVIRTTVAPIRAPAQAGPTAPVAVEPPVSGTESADTIELVPPGNSTLEIRVARRPWLLEKLSGKSTKPSQKMNPPRPPADLADPPSMSRIFPKVHFDIPHHVVRDPDNATTTKRTMPVAPTDDQGRPSFADVPNRDGVLVQSESVGTVEQAAPLKDRATTRQSTDDSNQHDAEEFDLATELKRSSTHVIPGQVAPPGIESGGNVDDKQVAAEGSEASSPPVVSEPSTANVPMRKLSIEADGKPADQESSDLAKTAEGPSAESAEPDEKDASSHYVGDLEGTGPVEEVAEELPKQQLDYTGHPQQPIRLGRSAIRMKGMMQQCLRYYYNRPEIANERSNWGMMHAIMVYGIDTKVIVGRQRYSAIAWIAGNNACRGQKILSEEDGNLVAKSGVGLQGHQAQLLAVLSLAGVPENYKLYAGDTPYSVKHLIEAEQRACKKGEELTFTLIGLSHYLSTDARWKNAAGEAWDFEKLIREELAQPIVGAACGGTHRLMGFAHALRARRAEGLPITGQWDRAEKYVQNFVNYTYRLQNRDGSMSTDWFEGREDNGDLDRKVQTTGHMVEWLLTVTPDSNLQNPRLISAIRFLLKSMYEERDKEWEIGPKGHALRSLAMYYERVYQSGPAWQTRSMARSNRSRQR